MLSSLKLADDDRFDLVQAALKKVVPAVERIRVRRVKGAPPSGVRETIQLDVRGAQDLPAQVLSEGTLVTVALLTSICAGEGRRLVLLDDIDHGLHPVAQVELVRQIKRLLAEMPDVQIVATTHSPFILDELDPADVCVCALRADGSVAVKRLSEHPDAGKVKGALSGGQNLDARPRREVGRGRERLMRIAVFCEAAGDFSTAAGLCDRVLREEGPEWVREHLAFRPVDDVREWVGADGRPFFDVHRIHAEARERGIRLPRNQFRGQAGGFGALLAYTAFLLARDEASRSGPIESVVLVWDMDDQGDARRRGLDEGRRAASHYLAMIVGCPDPEREVWVLAGFEPANRVEHDRLEEERRALELHPCVEAHRLRDKDEQAPRSAKRVLRKLTDGDPEREARCWNEAPLAVLRARGEHSGLAAFLDELTTLLAPALGRPAHREKADR